VLFGEEQLLARVRHRTPGSNSNTDRFYSTLAVAGFSGIASIPTRPLWSTVLDEPAVSFCLRIHIIGHCSSYPFPQAESESRTFVDEYLNTVRSRNSETANQSGAFLHTPRGRYSLVRIFRRFIVVPDGKLHLLPFDALKDAKGKYVLESHVVTYAPSATVLGLLRTATSSDPTILNFSRESAAYPAVARLHCVDTLC
jgi:hypothetical protein